MKYLIDKGIISLMFFGISAMIMVGGVEAWNVPMMLLGYALLAFWFLVQMFHKKGVKA